MKCLLNNKLTKLPTSPHMARPPIWHVPPIWHNLGAAYAEMGRYSKAVWAFEEAVRLNPDDRVARRNLKMAYEKIKG